MSNSLKALFAFIVFLVVLVGGVSIYTFPHWWLRAGTAEARSPTGYVYEAKVYKSTKGDLLFVVRQDSLMDEYIFYPTTGEIGIPSIDQFLLFSPVAYSKDVPVPVVLSTDKTKVEMDMDISLDEKHLEFTTHWGWRIKADTSKY